MSETPLPQTLSAMQSADAPDEASTTGEFRARRRSTSSDLRPVSAFAPGGHGTGTHGAVSHERGRKSDPPASTVAPSRAPSEEDLRFVTALRSSGIASELTDAEVSRTFGSLRSSRSHDGSSSNGRAGAQSAAGRRLDVLAAYYAADGDALAAQRRQAMDRWFLFQASDALTAHQLLARLLDVVPELQGTRLERVGGQDGTLVVRAGDDVCALEDEREDHPHADGHDTSANGLSDEPRASTISVCDLVRAINVLLDRRSVRARLVGLIGDGQREAYLGLPSVTAAIVLSSADYLAVSDAEALLDLTGW